MQDEFNVDDPWSLSPVVATSVVIEAGRLRIPGSAMICEALTVTAGRVRVVGQLRIRAAVAFEAGTVDLWPMVAVALDLERGFDIGTALRREAGALGLPKVAVVMPPSVQELPALASPANRGLWVAAVGFAVAALALFALGLPATPSPERIDVARVNEVVVEDLVAAAGVEVWLDEADDGSMILWVDEKEVAL